MQGNRNFKTFVDESGLRCVSVELAWSDKRATIDEDSFLFLCRLGLSPAWHLGAAGVSAFCASKPGRYALVGRVLLDAKPNQVVEYIDGDRLNLRRSNL